MFKVTLKLARSFLLVTLMACNNAAEDHTKEDRIRIADAASEAIIDSAYTAINRQCDSLRQFKVPIMADSLLKNDSLDLNIFFDTSLYINKDEKAEKVIRQLQADCDSSLQKETYKIYRQQQRSKPKRRIKKTI